MHSLPQTGKLPLEERPWTIVIVLTLWAGVVSVAIVAAGGFDDPRPACNGWVRLLTVGATWAALVWAVRTVYPQRARRLKMAVAVSLAAHTLLVVALGRAGIQFQAVTVRPPAEHVTRGASPIEIVLPEDLLDLERHRVERDAFERPIATGPPAAPQSSASRRPAEFDQLAKLPEDMGKVANGPSTAPPPLERRSWESTAMSEAAPRRRRTAGVKLPKATVVVPEVAIQDRTKVSDSVRSGPSVPTLARSAPRSAAPIVSTAGAPTGIGRTLRPRRAVAPWRVDAASTGLGTTLPTLPTRPPRLAMLPTAGRGASRMLESDSTATSERRPAAAFADRVRAGPRGRGGGRPGGAAPSETDAAIARGLEFLASVQCADGRWSFDDLGHAVAAGSEPVSIRADAAATGLALAAFLGAGYDHLDGRYRNVVADALDYLVRIQDDAGALFPEDGEPTGQVARFYGHGIATLALCEAYGMTGDSQLRRPAQRAIDYLAGTQHAEYGGWRYVPGINTDLSVTGWQLVALRSGRLAGLSVPEPTLARIRSCLDACRDAQSGGGLFRYNPWALPTDPTTRHGREPSTVMTSVGLLMDLYLGAEPTDPRVRRGAGQLLANLPQPGESPTPALTSTLGNPWRDTYYWYYGTQAMGALGGSYWATWRAELEPLLVGSQVRGGPAAGSWDPLRPVPDKWATYGGRLYVTAMNLLSLEADTRQLRPEATAPPRVADRFQQ